MSSIAVSGFISGGDIGDIKPPSKFSHWISSEQSTVGMLDGAANGCSKVPGDVGVIGCCCWPGGRGRAQFMSAVTDIVGLSFFATDMATHKHPHITSNSLH